MTSPKSITPVLSGLTQAEIEQAYPGQAELRQADKYTYRYPGGESYLDADLRAAAALREIAATGVRRPLIVSHEMIGRMLVSNLLDLDPRLAFGYKHPSSVIYRVDAAAGTLDELVESGTLEG